jgi:hypothetical protein
VLYRAGVWTLARKILLHDRIKFTVAAAGVSISVMLVLVQIGLYLGFMQNASNLIDHADGRRVGHRRGQRELRLLGADRRARVLPGGVDARRGARRADAARLRAVPAGRRRHPGRAGDRPRPWRAAACGRGTWWPATCAASVEPGAIVTDVSEAPKLKVGRVGERREIFGARAEVVALTQRHPQLHDVAVRVDRSRQRAGLHAVSRPTASTS